MKRRHHRNLAIFVLFMLLIGGLCWVGMLGWIRQERDYALTDAVGRRDLPAVRKLLESGADPNARWSGYRWSDRLSCMLQRTDLCADWENYTVWDRAQGDREMVALLNEYRTRR